MDEKSVIVSRLQGDLERPTNANISVGNIFYSARNGQSWDRIDRVLKMSRSIFS
jgi:hypothetical protein